VKSIFQVGGGEMQRGRDDIQHAHFRLDEPSCPCVRNHTLGSRAKPFGMIIDFRCNRIEPGILRVAL
jgi:hypothetical protein